MRFYILFTYWQYGAKLKGMRTFVACLAVLLIPQVVLPQNRPAVATPLETYKSAEIDSNGSLVITRTDGKTVVIAKKRGQSSFIDPVVSEDGTSVATRAGFRSCCASYDVPMELLIFRNGRMLRLVGWGLPIFHWRFVGGGNRVAFGEEPVHFGCKIHYELRDVDTGRQLDTVNVPIPCGQRPHPDPVKIPDWAEPIVPIDLKMR